MLRHTREIHEYRRDHKCDICDKTFKRPVQLTAHKAYIHESDSQRQLGKNVPEDLKCETCNESFITRSDFKDHIKRIHEKRKILTCKVCDKTFTLTASLYTHLRLVHQSKSFKCETCEKTFATRNYLTQHIEEIHEFIENIFECSQCDKTFDKTFKLKNHKTCVHSKRLTHKCTECHQMFDSLKSYNDHKILKHTEEWKEKIFCISCERIFLSKAQLTFHDRTVHYISKNFDCDICGKTFCKLLNLERHKTLVHAMKSLHQKCDICSKLFPTKSDLKSHLKNVHEKGNFSCIICLLKFSNRDSVKEHFRNHNENKYNCKDCNQSFKIAKSLDNQYLKDHENSKKISMPSNNIGHQEVTNEY